MKKLLVTLSLCSFMLAWNAHALEPLPAPKLPGDAPAAAEKKEPAAEGKGKKGSSSKSSSSKDKGEGKDSKDEKDDSDKEKDDSEDSDKKAEEDIKPEPKIAGDISFQGDSRIKTLLYDETDVYTITTRYGYQTNIVFSQVEEIQLISVGDRSLWQIIPNGNRMFIRPMEEDVITNMTVITNKHSYQFDLKSLPADKGGNIYVAKFVYDNAKKPAALLPPGLLPPEAFAAAPSAMPASLPPSSPFGVGPSIPAQQQNAAVPAASPPQALALQPQPSSSYPPAALPEAAPAMAAGQPAAAMSPAPASSPTFAAASAGPNYSYTYAGPDELAPLQVYDDGRSTYLKYRDVKKLPPNVYVVDKSGRESPVGYSVKGDYMVLDVVAGELALKGADNISAVHVFNEVLNPG